MEITFIIISIVLIIVLIMSKEVDSEDMENEKFSFRNDLKIEKEPQFYHPTTGYKGTRSEMDAYIVNREKSLKNDNNQP